MPSNHNKYVKMGKSVLDREQAMLKLAAFLILGSFVSGLSFGFVSANKIRPEPADVQVAACAYRTADDGFWGWRELTPGVKTFPQLFDIERRQYEE